jgi:hypothetical protein
MLKGRDLVLRLAMRTSRATRRQNVGFPWVVSMLTLAGVPPSRTSNPRVSTRTRTDQVNDVPGRVRAPWFRLRSRVIRASLSARQRGSERVRRRAARQRRAHAPRLRREKNVRGLPHCRPGSWSAACTRGGGGVRPRAALRPPQPSMVTRYGCAADEGARRPSKRSASPRERR